MEKEIIERIYRNCFAPMTLENIERMNMWRQAYINLGDALKNVLENE